MNPEEQKKRDDYIEYVRIMYERRSTKARTTGFTSWALVAALIYIFWQSIPLIKQAQGSANWVQLVVLFSAHIAAMMSTGFICWNMLSSSLLSPNDYRLDAKRSTMPLLVLSLVVLVAAGIPAILSLAAWMNTTSISSTHYRLLSANAWILGAVYTGGLVGQVYSYLKWERTGYPSTLAWISKKGFQQRANSIFVVVLLTLLTLNLYFLYEGFTAAGSNASESSLLLAMNGILSVTLFMAILISIAQEEALTALLRIERDAVIHDLPAEEIRKRIESDYLGQALGGWLNEQLTELRQLRASLTTACNRYPELDATLRKVDPSLIYERKGRLLAYIHELKELVANLFRKWTPLAAWMRAMLDRPTIDGYVRGLLKDAYGDETRHLESVKMETAKILDALCLAIAQFEQQHQDSTKAPSETPSGGS